MAVIGQVIPLVGYFTIMDTFVTMSFSLLSGIVAVHFFVQILDNSAEKYPLNKLLAAMIVLVSSCCSYCYGYCLIREWMNTLY